MQVAQDNLEIAYRESGHYDRRVAELQERLRRQPEDRDAPLGAGPRLRGAGPPRRGDRGVRGAARLASRRRRRPCSSSAWPRRRAAASTRPATGCARACEQDPDSAVARFYYGEVLLQPRAQRAGARRAARRDRAQSRLRRSALPARVRLRRHGPARGGARGDQARHRAQPDARAGPGEPRARALRRPGRRRAGGGGRRRERRAPQPVRGRAARALQPRARLPAEGLLTTRRCASTAWRSRPARTAASTLQAMAEVHLLRRELRRGARAVRRAAPRVPRLAQALERARRLPAPGRPARRGDRLLRAGGRGRPRLPARLEQPRRRAGARARRRGRDRRRSGRRSAATGRSSRRGSTSALLLLPAAPAPARRSRSTSRRSPSSPRSAVAWNGVGLVLMELQAVRGRAQRLRPRGGRRPGLRGGALQPELRPEPAGRLRRRAAGDPARARARAATTCRRSSRSRSTCSTRTRRSRSRPSSRPRSGGDDARRASSPSTRRSLDQLFEELAPPAAGRRPARRRRATRSTSRATTSRKGLLDLATAELSRARRRGARRSGATAVLLGDIFAQRGLLRRGARALPRGPRRRCPTIPTPPWARSARCWRWAGPATRRRSPTSWRAGVRGDVEVLVARARVRLGGGRRARRARLHPRGAGARARAAPTSSTCRPRSPPGWATARPRSPPSTRRCSSIPRWCGCGTSWARWRRSGANWARPRARLRARARPAADLPRGGARARRPAAPHASRRARRSTCWCDCSRPIPTTSRRSPRWAARCSRTAAPTQALEAFERVLRFDPEHAGALYHRASRWRGSGSSSDAVEAWERVVQLDPAGPYAAQARSRARSARDLQHIFAAAAG